MAEEKIELEIVSPAKLLFSGEADMVVVPGGEGDFGVAGTAGENPWEAPRGPFPMPPMPFSYQAQVLAQGVEKLGGHPLHGPLAVASIPYQGREACNGCGFCMQGCRNTAKSGRGENIIYYGSQDKIPNKYLNQQG